MSGRNDSSRWVAERDSLQQELRRQRAHLAALRSAQVDILASLDERTVPLSAASARDDARIGRVR
eukprot:COSAG06_NODE_45097_length_357_cov_1.534884_1_plen_64_part_10